MTVSGDRSMESSLTVTEAIITGCLLPVETLPGATTSRQQLRFGNTVGKRKCRPARFPADIPNITPLTAVLFTHRHYLPWVWFGGCKCTLTSDPWRKSARKDRCVNVWRGWLQMAADRKTLVLSDTGGWRLFTVSSQQSPSSHWHWHALWSP